MQNLRVERGRLGGFTAMLLTLSVHRNSLGHLVENGLWLSSSGFKAVYFYLAPKAT